MWRTVSVVAATCADAKIASTLGITGAPTCLAMTKRLIVDPIERVGHRMCAAPLPEPIIVDAWRFPIIAPREIDDLTAYAPRAVDACSTLALVDAVCRRLQAIGVPDECVHFERFEF